LLSGRLAAHDGESIAISAGCVRRLVCAAAATFWGHKIADAESQAQKLAEASLRHHIYSVKSLRDQVARSEVVMILFELLFALMLAAGVLLVFPLLVLAASLAGIMLLWVLAPTVLLAGLVLWLVFPHFAGLVTLIFVLVIGFSILDRRYARRPIRRWQ
jgi:hypothetical protein